MNAQIATQVDQARAEFEQLEGRPPNVCRVSSHLAAELKASAVDHRYAAGRLAESGVLGRYAGMDIIENPAQTEPIVCEFVR